MKTALHIDPSKLSPAEQLLWQYGITSPKQIDLEAIAYDLNAEVVYRILEGCEARLVAHGDRAVISISPTVNDGRQRFSLGHELAHWTCDRDAGAFLCAKEDIGPQSTEARSMESRANAYASQLLLPNYLVDPWMNGRAISLDTADQLSKHFSASLTASAIRLIDRTPANACLACHDQTRLVWCRKGRAFPQDFFVVNQLHQDVDAFRIVFGGLTGMTRPKRQPADRWVTARDVYRLEVTTQSLRLPDGNALTMLVF